MVSSRESLLAAPVLRRAPSVGYSLADAGRALAAPGALAVFGFGAGATLPSDPRCLRVALEPVEPAPLEVWRVDAEVASGSRGGVQWASGGGWLFAAIELDEARHGGPAATAEAAYTRLNRFLAGRAERHVLRIWNYLNAINLGDGDGERYKQFCSGRARGMGDAFASGFPAATAIGYNGADDVLQVYLLACDQPGTRVENPRQVSAWRYPRQYGRAAPRFARAMQLPAADALAISGTAAVVGHSSAHHDDLGAQFAETLTNLRALLRKVGLHGGFGARSPLKVYVRHPDDAPHVRALCDEELPGVPLLLVQGDVCRRELLVEIDGWCYAGA